MYPDGPRQAKRGRLARAVSLAALLGATLAGRPAAADASLANETAIGDAIVDLDAARVVRKSTTRARCASEDGAYARGLGLPLVKSWKNPALHFAYATPRALLFASWWDQPQPHAALIDVTSGTRLLDVADTPAAIVEDASGALLGLLVVDAGGHQLRLLDGKTGAVRWRTPIIDLFADAASVRVDGDRLLVALFHRNATGSSLWAFELASGRLRWQADVVQLQVGHSKYANDVSLELRGTSVVLRGIESAGCYVQIFDGATGKRRFDLIDKRW